MRSAALIAVLVLAVPTAFASQVAAEAGAKASENWRTEQRQLNSRFVELFRDERYEEGKELAELVLRRAEEQYGYDAVELFGPLMNLATLQRVRGDYRDSLFHYERNLAIIERRLGYDAMQLVGPLHGLARTYMRTGDYEAAQEPLARALRVTHANTGIYSLEQGPTRDLLSNLELSEGDLEQANLHQRIQVRAHERRYGTGDPRVVPSLYKLGEWYERTRQTALQRASYAAADRLIQAANGEDSLDRVQALRGQASSFLKESRREKAEEFLKRALNIVRAHPIQDLLQQAMLLVEIGDAQTIFNRLPLARQNYQEAWELLSANDEGLDLRAELLQHPVIPLRSAQLPVQVPRELGNPSRYEQRPRAGSMVLQLTLEADGRVSAAKVMESNPSGLIDAIVVALLKGARFRPHMRDGEPVRAENVIYRHRFRWYKRREPESPAEIKTPPEPAKEDRPIDYPGES